MHDAIWFEIHGVPAAALVSEAFEDAAQDQASALGMPDARRVLVEHPIQDATDDEMRAKADQVIDRVIAALIR